AGHDQLAVGEVDQSHDPEYERDPESEQRVEAPQAEPVDDVLDRLTHRASSPNPFSRTAPVSFACSKCGERARKIRGPLSAFVADHRRRAAYLPEEWKLLLRAPDGCHGVLAALYL